MDKIAYGAAKKYVDKTVDGLGAIKGAPCTIKSITETDDENIIVFEWTGNSGEKETSTLTIKNGSSKILTGNTFENPIILSNLESGLYIFKNCYVTDWVSEDVDVIFYVEPILVSINTDNATYIFFRNLVNYFGYYSYYEDGEIYVEYNLLLYSNSPEADTNYVPLTDSSLTTKKYVDDMSAYSLAKKGGYSGTEEEFAEKLAAEIPSKTSDLTNDSGFTTLALDDTLTDNTKAAPAGIVGELKGDIGRLSEEIEDLTSLQANGISQTSIHLLITILKSCFTQSDQTSNIDALEIALKGGTNSPESGVTQNGSILTIISDVSVTQNGNKLLIA